MKIITNDRLSSVALTTGDSLGPYLISNITNNVPGQPFSLTTGSVDGSGYQQAVITISTSGTVDSFFISGLSADSASYAVDGVSSVSLNTSYHSSYDEWIRYNTGLIRPEFVEITSTTSPSVVLTLKSINDLKDSPISGSAIGYWQLDNPSAVSGGTATGRFYTSSGGTVVNVINHGRVKVGSFVQGTYDGSTTVAQVTKIKGDGTAQFGIELNTQLDSGTINYIRNPIKIGCLKIGQRSEVPNPQTGASREDQDYSRRFSLFAGGYSNRLHPKVRSYSCNFNVLKSNGDALLNYFDAVRSEPFAVKLIDHLDETVMLSHLTGPPSSSYETKTGGVLSISATFREIQ